MHNTIPLLSLATLLHLAHSHTATGSTPPTADAPSTKTLNGVPPNYECSSDTSDAAVVDFANTDAWQKSMLNCLNQMNNEAWNGYECQPDDGNNGTLGPAFDFYKGGEHNNGLNCYDYCEPCLQLGIENRRAVTTSCSWAYEERDGMSCWMGFNYGG